MNNEISYKEIEKYCSSASTLCYINNKLAAFLIYKFQNLPLTANTISIFSFLLALLAILFLFLNLKLIFILLLVLSYTFDNIDGTWARLKKQTSVFGGFFDTFLDEAKVYLIDLTLIVFYFDNIKKYIPKFKLILIV